MQRRFAEARTLHVGLGALAVAALHVVFVQYSPGPVLYSDSMEYLGVARTLAGAGQPITFDFSATTASGYSILLAPAYLVTTDPHAVFLFALALNVIAGASIFVAGYLLTREVFGTSHRVSLFAGALAAAYPGYLLQSGQVWPEALLAAEVMWWLVLLARFLQRGGLGTAVGLGLLTGFAWTTHRRMAGMVLITLVVLAFVGWRRRDCRVGALLAGAETVVLVGLTALLEHWITDRLWNTPPVNQNGSSKLLTGLRPEHWGNVTLAALGEAWYLAAGSLCLVFLGAIGYSQCVLRRRARLVEDGDPQALVALTALAATLGTLVIGAVSLWPPPARVDNLVYGRYVEEFSGAMIVAATAVLVGVEPTTRRRIAVLIAPLVCFLASAVALYQIRGHAAFVGSVQKLVVPAILGEQAVFTGKNVFPGAMHFRTITALVALVFAALILLRRVSAGAAVLGAGAAFLFFASLGQVWSLHPFVSFWNDVYRCAPTAIEDRYGGTGGIAMTLQGLDPEARNAYQFRLPNYRFIYFDGRNQPPSRLVLAPRDWPEGRAMHYTPVTGELIGAESLWVSTARPPRRPVLADGAVCPAVKTTS